MKNFKMHIILGKNIKYYRIKGNLTQEELSEKCNLSPRYISYLENGIGNLTLDNLIEISRALKIDTYLLLKDNELNIKCNKIYKRSARIETNNSGKGDK